MRNMTKKETKTTTNANLMFDIVNILQQEVDSIAKNKFGYDKETPPIFRVSILYGEKDETHKIILTIEHGGQFSMVIFPKNNTFDYITIEEEMGYLFGATV